MTITTDDIDRVLGFGRYRKKAAGPTPDDSLVINRFDVPPITGQEIVKSVTGTGGPWRTIEQVLAEADNERRARKFRERHEMNEIPEPTFAPEDSELW